jgi:hypothetical protein
MKTKVASTLMIIAALVFGSSATAEARPYVPSKSVTYWLGVKSGNPADSMVYYMGENSMSWRPVTASPWVMTVRTNGMGNMNVRSMASDYKWPTYVCKIFVNGVFKYKNEGYGSVSCYEPL